MSDLDQKQASSSVEQEREVNSIRRQVNDVVEQARENLTKQEEERDRIYQLPESLVDHDFGDNHDIRFYGWGKSIYLTISLSGDEDTKRKAVEDIKDFFGKEFSFAFEKIRYQYNKNFAYSGELNFGGTSVEVEVSGAPQPEGCKLIEKRELKEVITYEAECGQTGEKV